MKYPFWKITGCVILFATTGFLTAGIWDFFSENNKVTIDPFHGYEMNGFHTIQSIFSGVFNGGDGGQATKLIKSLNLNGARSYFWVKGNPKMPAVPWSQFSNGHGTREKAMAEYKKWFSQDFEKTLADEIRYNVNHPRGFGQHRQLKYYVEDGIDQNIVFHQDMHGIMLEYPEETKKFFKAYTENILRNAPYLKNMYYIFSNEPNYPAWTGQFASTKDAVDSWIRIYDILDEYTRTKLSKKVKLIGPCQAGGSFYTWFGYENWCKATILGVKIPMDYYNYQGYDVGRWSHLSWTSMFQAEAERAGRKRPLAIITESTFRCGVPNIGGERMNWFAQQLFMQLDNPDKYAQFCAFLAVFRGNVSDLITVDPESRKTRFKKWIYSDTAYLYLVLNELRGDYIYTTPYKDSSLRTVSVRNGNKKIVFAVFNDSSEKKTVIPNIQENLKVEKILLKQVDLKDGKKSVFYREYELASNEKLQLTLPPQSVASISWTLAEPLKPVSGKYQRMEYYAPVANETLVDQVKTHIVCKSLPPENAHCRVRVGVFIEDDTFAHGGTLVFNGKNYPFLWDQTPPEINSSKRQGAYLEIPIARNEINGTNNITIKVKDTSYHLMFLSLVVKEEDSAKTANDVFNRDHSRQIASISANLIGPNRIRAGIGQKFYVDLNNSDSQPRTFSVDMTLPKSFSLVKGKKREDVIVPPESRKSVKYVLNSVDDGNRETRNLNVSIQSSGLETKYLSKVICLDSNRQLLQKKTPWEAIVPIRTQYGNLKLRCSKETIDFILETDMIKRDKENLPKLEHINFRTRSVVGIRIDGYHSKLPQMHGVGIGEILFHLNGKSVDTYQVHRVWKGDWFRPAALLKTKSKGSVETMDKGKLRLSGSVLLNDLQYGMALIPGKPIGLDVAIYGEKTVYLLRKNEGWKDCPAYWETFYMEK